MQQCQHSPTGQILPLQISAGKGSSSWAGLQGCCWKEPIILQGTLGKPLWWTDRQTDGHHMSEVDLMFYHLLV